MLDGLLKSKFFSKCKSSIKMTKTRYEIIKRKRIAMQKYLKNDMVDLLKNGFDTNAYGRIEGLWNELNLSSCYDLVEKYCTTVSTHLSNMDKQRECPEECREAVSSLMFAAARFYDLPELRDLRTLFTERYGNALEFYVNKEFVHKLKSTPPTKDMKLQLMQDIALESGIEWNSKTLEQKLYNNPTPDENNGNDGKTTSPRQSDDADTKVDNNGVEYKHKDRAKHTVYDGEGGNDARDKRRSTSDPSSGLTVDNVQIKDIQVDLTGRKGYIDKPFIVSASEEENEDKKPVYYKNIRPPYTKGVEYKTVHPDEPSIANASEEENNDEKPFYYKAIRPPYTKVKISLPSTTADVPSTGADTKGLEDKESSWTGSSDEIQHDDSIGSSKPKPKSVRRRNMKTHPGRDKVENTGGVGSETLGSNGIYESGGNEGRLPLRIINERQHEERNEEEKVMDRLLMHYSTKMFPHDTDKSEAALEPSPQPATIKTGSKMQDRSRDARPTRVVSLPSETSPTEGTKMHARASSFQPEVLNSNGHIHPKLPEYDDFVARLAALRANAK